MTARCLRARLWAAWLSRSSSERENSRVTNRFVAHASRQYSTGTHGLYRHLLLCLSWHAVVPYNTLRAAARTSVCLSVQREMYYARASRLLLTSVCTPSSMAVAYCTLKAYMYVDSRHIWLWMLLIGRVELEGVAQRRGRAHKGGAHFTQPLLKRTPQKLRDSLLRPVPRHCLSVS